MTRREPPVADAETKEKDRSGAQRQPATGFALLVSCEAGAYVVPLPHPGAYVVGRSADCDVTVPDDSISRKHARLRVDDEMTLEDLGSKNGTTAQGKRLEKGEPHPIAIGTAFELGSATFVLQRSPGASGKPLPPLPGEPAAAARVAATQRPAPSAAASNKSGAVLADATMRNLYAMLDVVGPSPLSVLVLGETGVGKELFAAEVHGRSTRAAGPFLRLNCAALPESILEAELFGHEKGAFTGAVQARAGLFESADGGTVFLDEVAELPLSTQAKLLRVLESGEVLRLGSARPRHVNVRFVAATNGDPRHRVAAGSFRADLYFRLNGISITLPPLRNRKADVAPLARHFTARACEALGRKGVALTAAAVEALERHSWPGNVRELRNVIDRAVVLCKERELDVACLVTADSEAFGDKPREDVGSELAGGLKNELKSLERKRILDALEETAGNQSRAAKLLGMSRYTLMSRIEEYGLARPRKRS